MKTFSDYGIEVPVHVIGTTDTVPVAPEGR